MKYCLLALLVAPMITLVSTAQAQTPLQEFSMSVVEPSTCSNLNLSLGMVGDNYTNETVVITDESGASLLSMESQHAPESSTSLVERTLSVPAASSKTSGYIGINYTIKTSDSDAEKATFFSIYDCAAGTMLYSCLGRYNCPTSAAEYLPSAHYERSALRFGTVKYKDPHSYESTSVPLQNLGIVDLRIKDVSLEGPDAREFRFHVSFYGDVSDFRDLPMGYRREVTIYVTMNARKRVGTRHATLRVETNDPIEPIKLIPISAKVVHEPDLSLDLNNVVRTGEGDLVTVSGELVIKNIGFKTSKPGRKVSVSLYDQNSCPEDRYTCLLFRRTLFSTHLPALRPGKRVVIKFTSKEFSASAHFFDSMDEIYGNLDGTDLDYENDFKSFYFREDTPQSRYYSNDWV